MVTYHCDDAAKHGQGQSVESSTLVAGAQMFHKKGNKEKGETSGATETRKSSARVARDEVEAKDSFRPRVNFKNQEGSEDITEEAPREQDLAVTSGPTKRMGLLNYTPTGKACNVGLNPKNNKIRAESTWQVYSRQRRCQKKSQMGHSFSTTVTEIHRSSLPPQLPQNTAQHRTAYNASQDPIIATPVNSGDLEANSDSEIQHIQEAAHIWSTAKQLGASGREEQNMIIEKIKHMEERDKTEAERRGDSRRNQ